MTDENDVRIPFLKDDSSSNGETDQTAIKQDVFKLIIGMMMAVIKTYLIISLIFLNLIVIVFIIYGFLPVLLLAIVAFIALFYQISDQLVFWPNFPPDSRETVRLPSSVGLPSENLFLYGKDGVKLHAVFIKQNSHTMKSVPTFVYLHGNAGNMGHRLPNVYDMYRYLGINILLVEYRGFGLSQGISSESGLYMDAETAISYLRTRTDIDLNKIVLFGRSLGGAVAINCASLAEMRSRIAALIVENTFTSIPEMAKCLFSGVKIITSLPSWCHKNKFNSKVKMCKIVVPTLMLSGLADTLVPPRMMMELYRSCPSKMKKLYQFTNGSHNETWRCRGYYQTLSLFLDEIFHRKNNNPRPLPVGVYYIKDSQVL